MQKINDETSRQMREEDDISALNIMPLVREAVNAALHARDGLGIIDQIAMAQGGLVFKKSNLRMNVIAIRLPGACCFGNDYRTATRIRDGTAALSPYCNVLVDTDGFVEDALTKRGFPVNVVEIPAELRHDAGRGATGYTSILIFDRNDTATLFAEAPQ